MPILLWLLLFFLIAVVVGTVAAIYKKANVGTPVEETPPDGSA